MGAKIADLLKWRKKVILNNPKTNEPLLDEETGQPVEVWIRLVGDYDLKEAYRIARVKSARLRSALRDPNSDEYMDRIDPLKDNRREDDIKLIQSNQDDNFYSEAVSAVVRPDLPELSEFAVDPDAPTLEEQEKFDQAVLKQEQDYQEAISQYIKVREDAANAELESLSDEELRKKAIDAGIDMLCLATFLQEAQDQKVYRGTFTDKLCKNRAFDSFDEYINADEGIKTQLLREYIRLEINPEQLKN